MIRGITFVTGFAVAASVASADFVGVDLRSDAQWNADATAAINDGNDYVVIRMFAAFDANGENDTVLSVGHVNDPDGGFGLITSGFFQETTLGGDTAPDSGFFGFSPAAEWDTYVSIGRIVADGGDATSLDPNFAFLDQVNPNALDDFVQGGWFNSSPSNSQGDPDFNAATSRYETFLGQFTVRSDQGLSTDGVSSVIENNFLDGELSIFTPSDEALPAVNQVSFIGIPGPGAGALLGVAGIAGLRRRR